MKDRKDYVKKIVESDMRIDERGLLDFREMKVETGVVSSAEGSARVTIGKTQVLVGIKMSVGKPFPDTPAEGVMMVGVEFSPIASPDFEPGPPSPEATEVARVVDRGIRESKCIDLEKLCITENEEVWMISIDIHVLNHDGNLMDASSLGAIAALLNTQIPKCENGKAVFGEYSGKLPIRDKPIEVTINKISNKFLIDPCLEEEEAVDARLTFALNEKDDICAMQKGGKGHFTVDEIKRALEIATEKSKQIRSLIS